MLVSFRAANDGLFMNLYQDFELVLVFYLENVVWYNVFDDKPHLNHSKCCSFSIAN